MFYQTIIEYLQNNYEYFLRILLSAGLGFLIGLDRESKNKPAGIKTFTYVAVACTLLTIVSIVSVERFSDMNDGIRMDPLRLAAQIVSGLGFLGAGVILKDGIRIQGLTSAAMILFAGGVGIGIGAGFYGVVIFAIFTSMVIAKGGEKLERRWSRKTKEAEKLKKETSLEESVQEKSTKVD